MALAGEPDRVNEGGDADEGGVSNEQTQEEWSGLIEETNASEVEYGKFDDPG